MISICCVGIESISVVVSMNLMIVPGSWSVAISDKCVHVYCVEALLISSAIVIVRTGGAFG